MAEQRQQQVTVIGPDAHFKGEMTFDGSARILGRFEGRIASSGQIEVGEGAMCEATVEADHVIVDGEVCGDVVGRSRIDLNERARVRGDLTAGNLVVVEGAEFEGHCRVGPEAVSAATSRRETAPVTPREPTSPVETRQARPARQAPEPVKATGSDQGAVDQDWMKLAGENADGAKGSSAA